MDHKLLSSQPHGNTADLDPLPSQSEGSRAPWGLVARVASLHTLCWELRVKLKGRVCFVLVEEEDTLGPSYRVHEEDLQHLSPTL